MATTKRDAEGVANWLSDCGIRCQWLHSELKHCKRAAVFGGLRQGAFDVLVGINLLREGIDLPDVSLVAILDADKAGFLRSETSLIQMIGRAARHINARAFLYADAMTGAMKQAIAETRRRRRMQTAYNRQHGITPQTIQSRNPEKRGDRSVLSVV